MKNKLLKGLVLILTSIIFILTILNAGIGVNIWEFMATLIGIIFGTIIVNSLFQKLISYTTISTKSVLIKYLIIYTLFYSLSLVIHKDFTNIINIIVNYFAIFISSILVYMHCRREYKAGIRQLLACLSLVLSLVFIIDLNRILLIGLIFPIALVNIANYIDASTLLRKRNLFYYFCATLILIIGSFFNKLVFIALIPLFEKNNRGDKKSIIINGFFSLVSVALLLFVPNNLFSVDILNRNVLLALMLSFMIAISILPSYTPDKRILSIIILYSFIHITFIRDDSNLISVLPLLLMLVYPILARLRIRYSINIPQKTKEYLRVSAVVPNYNYAEYLEERIDSIVSQDYKLYELIILDDCSKDNSVEVIKAKIKKLKENYPDLTVKFILNKKNSGNVFAAWLKAFEESSGDYLWICEADDSCSKHFLRNVMQGFKNDNVILSYSESKTIDEFGNVLKSDLRDWIDIFETDNWYDSYIHSGEYELKNYLCINNTIANVSGVVFKKDKLVNFKKYLVEAQKYTLSGDWYFYTQVLKHGDIAYCSKSLNYHRMHSKSVTLTTDNFVHYKEIKSIQNIVSKSVKISEEAKKRVALRDIDLKRNMCISEDELYYDKMSLEKLIKDKKITDKVLLSIIIPVYNVEAYLEKCLKSILKDLPIKTEIIIINDGSPDNSEDIILKYQKKHKEIKYIKKENGGLSSVKNRGLKEARGKYVIFLDSDDYVSSNMYNTMLKKALHKNADMVYCDILMTFEDGSITYCTMKNYAHEEKYMQVLDNSLMASSPNKMTKKELYEDLLFPEGLNNEDVAVSPILITRCNKIEHIPSPFYKYVQRSGSIQNSGFSEKRFVIFETAKLCFERMRDLDKKIQEQISGAILTHQILAILIYLIPKEKNKEQEYKYIESFCLKYKELKADRNNPYVLAYLKEHHMSKLIDYINEDNYDAIYKITNKWKVN